MSKQPTNRDPERFEPPVDDEHEWYLVRFNDGAAAWLRDDELNPDTTTKEEDKA
jgi:hypothetical protein